MARLEDLTRGASVRGVLILALVEVDGDRATPRYVRRPFHREPDFGAASVNYKIGDIAGRSENPQ